MRNFRGKTQEVVVLHSENLNTASSTGEGVGREDGKTRAELQVLRTLSSSSCPLSASWALAPRVLPHLRTKAVGLGDPLSEAAPRGQGKEVEAAAASLERWDLQRDRDRRLLALHQGDCMVDIFIPTPLPPSSISSLSPGMCNVGLSHLWEGATHPLLVLLLVLDGPSPVRQMF